MFRVRIQTAILTLAICAFCTYSDADDDGHQDRALEVLEKEVCGKSFAITGSGVVWTFVPEGEPRFHEGKRVSATEPLHLGYDDDLISIIKPPARNQIAFFDEGEWHDVPWDEPLSRRDRNGPYGRIVAGVDNTVLVVGRDTTLLVQGTRVVDHGELLDLIKENRELICASFGMGVPHPIRLDRWRKHTMVIADQGGRIWCLHDESLHVLFDEQWHDCREPLINAGSRRGSIAFIVPGPDHRYFFIGDHKMRHDGGRSFLAKIDDNEIVLESTYHAIEGLGKFPALRERNDALWISSPEGRSAGSSDRFTGQSAIRIDETGKATSTLRMSGYPIVSDPIGNTWLGGIRGGPTNQFNIVRNGENVQELKAPSELTESFHNSHLLPAFCNSAGSVFVHSEHGLAHFVADQESPHMYVMAKQYEWDKTKGSPQAFSSQGYCISLVADDDVPLKFIYLTKIP